MNFFFLSEMPLYTENTGTPSTSAAFEVMTVPASTPSSVVMTIDRQPPASPIPSREYDTYFIVHILPHLSLSNFEL